MPKTKKRFIDKKNATTFVIGHRSQKDPLIADETAPKNILIPLDQVPDLSRGGISAAQAAAAAGPPNPNEKEKRREEQLKYGIYFDDDYDYLQHLKDSNEVSTIKWDTVERIYAPNIPKVEPVEEAVVPTIGDLNDVKIKLPSSVFESTYKEDIGLLNKAYTTSGPRPDLDPDVVAALDEDFDHEDPENILEDDFVQLANEGLDEVLDGEPTAEDLEGLFSDGDEPQQDVNPNEEDDDSNYSDEEDDSLGSLNGGPQYSFDDDETKTQFTNYSMSSSVVRRNKQLSLVDDRFEKFFENYEDTEIGALDCDEIEGDLLPENDLLMKYAEEFEKDKEKEDDMNTKIRNLAIINEDESSDNGSSYESEEDQPKEKWDCQSIISTYSTTKNRPKIIREPSKKNIIKISGKTGLPVGVLGKGGLTKENLKMLESPEDTRNTTERSIMSGATSIRNKNETPEERRERKQLVKEYRKERRLEKKANTTAFKDEKKRIEKVRMNTKANVQGLKL